MIFKEKIFLTVKFSSFSIRMHYNFTNVTKNCDENVLDETFIQIFDKKDISLFVSFLQNITGKLHPLYFMFFVFLPSKQSLSDQLMIPQVQPMYSMYSTMFSKS